MKQLLRTRLQGSWLQLTLKLMRLGLRRLQALNTTWTFQTSPQQEVTVSLGQNGATGTSVTLSTASVAANVTALNTALDTQGGDLTAEAIGNHIRIFSDTDTEVVSLSFTFNAAASGNGTTVAFFTDLSTGTGAQQVNSGLKLHTTGSSGIQIDTGENIASDYGLTETNVGAADFDSNATQMTSGSQISGISVSTVADANAAITSIDAAIQQVSDSEASLGAVENRLNHVIANVSETIVNTGGVQV